jgi:hypothetical protein
MPEDTVLDADAGDATYSIPLHGVFRDLRREWLAQREGRTSAQLAEFCGVTAQRCSQWATGTDNRQPPWSAVLKICDNLDYEVVVKPKSGAHLRKKLKHAPTA